MVEESEKNVTKFQMIKSYENPNCVTDLDISKRVVNSGGTVC